MPNHSATHVATFVAAPQSSGLPHDLLARLASHLPQVQAPLWLSHNQAADLPFTPPASADLKIIADQLRGLMGGAPIDLFVQPIAHRQKKLFLADMDSTMIGQECIDELADFVGMKEHVSAITERAMRGEIAFEPALRERVALLKGLAQDIVARVISERITLTAGGRTLVQTMRAHGAYTALVSGGFTLFTHEIAQMIGFHENRANVLIVENDHFAGLVAEPILGREAKLASLIELRERHNLRPEDTMAVGDGANDLAMLEAAGLGIAFHAKPAVAAAAHARIDYGDLSALLFAQGYDAKTWVK
jgi:phosphoserine phosphatase